MFEVAERDRAGFLTAKFALIFHGMEYAPNLLDSRYLVTEHPVSDSEKEIKIGAGRIINVNQLGPLVNRASIGSKTNRRAPILTEKILSLSDGHISWYSKPKIIDINIKETQSLLTTMSIPVPGLIYTVTQNELFVCAFKGSDRPDAHDPVYFSPFMNVFENGKVCFGNVDIPDSSQVNDVEKWESLFFRSPFTHLCHSKAIKQPNGDAVSDREYLHFVEQLALKNSVKFPEEVLYETGLSVEDCVNYVAGMI